MIDSGHWLLHGVFAAILRRQDQSGCHRTARLSFRTGDNRGADAEERIDSISGRLCCIRTARVNL